MICFLQRAIEKGVARPHEAKHRVVPLQQRAANNEPPHQCEHDVLGAHRHQHNHHRRQQAQKRGHHPHAPQLHRGQHLPAHRTAAAAGGRSGGRMSDEEAQVEQAGVIDEHNDLALHVCERAHGNTRAAHHPPARLSRPSAPLKVQELDVEREGGAPRNKPAARALLTVRIRRRARHGGTFAHAHRCYRQLPAQDHGMRAQGEGERLPALPRRVKDLSVRQCADIVRCHACAPTRHIPTARYKRLLQHAAVLHRAEVVPGRAALAAGVGRRIGGVEVRAGRTPEDGLHEQAVAVPRAPIVVIVSAPDSGGEQRKGHRHGHARQQKPRGEVCGEPHSWGLCGRGIGSPPRRTTRGRFA